MTKSEITLTPVWFQDCPSLDLVGVLHGHAETFPMVIVSLDTEEEAADIVAVNSVSTGYTLQHNTSRLCKTGDLTSRTRTPRTPS